MPLTDSLISYWALEEASGNRADSHGANTLTDNNTVTQAVGKIGNAAQFTAANSESLSCADNADLSVGDIDFTFAAWVYLDDAATEREFISKGTIGIAGGEYRVEYSSTRMKFQIQDVAVTFKTTTDTTVIVAGTWYYVVAWHDATGDTVNIQVNNGSVISGATAGIIPLDGTVTFRIGSGNGARYWNGRVDEVGFWKRLLTTQERTDLYNGGAGLAYPFAAGQPLALRRRGSTEPTGARRIGRGW